ncbi:MAG: hypothetical protein QOI48_4592 [Solirubrobacteraceae bacterium]|jgi:hypothetical protein|nr:hypothetical protein [Solirubrobacteraceae bacterium]
MGRRESPQPNDNRDATTLGPANADALGRGHREDPARAQRSCAGAARPCLLPDLVCVDDDVIDERPVRSARAAR